MKKIISLLFTLIMVLACMPINTFAVSSETESGILYSVKDGVVTVEGLHYLETVMNVPEKIEGYPVKYIANQACRDHNVLTEVILPAGLEIIGEYAFAECDNLKKVTVKGCKTISVGAFRESRSLSKISLPKDLELIDDLAFENCVMLGKIKMPKGLKSIGHDAFMGCDRVSFDANGSKLVKDYAKRYNIPTSFFDTWEFTVLSVLVIGTAIIVGYYAVKRAVKTKTSKNNRK